MLLHSQGLPWNSEEGERRRLLRIAAIVCPIFLLASIYISWTQLPEPTREEAEKIPPQLARLIKKVEPPKPVIKKEEPKPELPKVAEKPKEQPKPKLKETPPPPKVAEKPKPQPPKQAPQPKEVELAREKAQNSGLLAMSDKLSALNAMANNVKLDAPKTITAAPIAAKKTDQLANQARTVVASGGVKDAQLSQATQKMDLSARKVTEVAQSEQVVAAVAAEKAVQAEAAARRTSEELRRTIDANKSAIYSIYNRALRKQPSLRGAVTPELVVESTGQVSSCKVVESTLNDADLESKICSRLLLVNFGPKPGTDRHTFRTQLDLIPG